MIVPETSPLFEEVKKSVINDFNELKNQNVDLIIVLPHMGTQFALKQNNMQNTWNKIFEENLMDDVKSVVRHEVSKCEERGVRDWATIKSTVKENLRDYLFIKTKRNPMIIPIIMEV